MKNTGRKLKKNKQRKTRKHVSIIKITRGGAWYSVFLPFFGRSNTATEENKTKSDDKIEQNKSSEDKKIVEEKLVVEEKPVVDEKSEEKASKAEDKTIAENKTSKSEEKSTKQSKYEVKSDKDTINKEFFENPNISVNAFDDPNYEKVGIVHVTSVVGINVLRSYSTKVINVIGKKGAIDENMHQLRNEIFLEMENVMKEKNIDKIENVNVAFTKDSATLILNAFGTALRKKQQT